LNQIKAQRDQKIIVWVEYFPYKYSFNKFQMTNAIKVLLQMQNGFFSRSGVEINFSDVNIVTEVEHFLPREQIFAP
jgi:hypothetical protein